LLAGNRPDAPPAAAAVIKADCVDGAEVRDIVGAGGPAPDDHVCHAQDEDGHQRGAAGWSARWTGRPFYPTPPDRVGSLDCDGARRLVDAVLDS
jgi:hypothetical protein